MQAHTSKIGSSIHIYHLFLYILVVTAQDMQSTDTSSRRRLVDAMASLLWEKGYAATSPRDVMAAAKVGQGSFYYHFSGKHELAVAALSQNISELLGQGADTASSSPLEKLKAYLVHPRPGLKGCRVGRMTQDPKVPTGS